MEWTKRLSSSDRSNGSGFPTAKTATADIFGADFVAMNITFSGYQDTLCANKGHQFYRECEIYGTVDFIFGDAKAVFQNSIIFARTPLNGKQNTITAQSRNSPTDIGGYVFHNCTIRAAPNLQGWVKTYFGRPWRTYSRVVIMQSDIHPLIDPKGWMNWDVTKLVHNLYYAEYDNRGAGADTSRRVGWCKLLHTKAEANQFTVRNFIKGNNWIPTQIPYFQDLM
ncbi:putative pectinesterase/pectinesterase inhibitor 38 [Impatiens glandulifera]|uniref:putative pectinesterase/pectinesterase inhibitor 38 n=1 Tax=Impatiens glandulifera TaxID=253017 RepID=UPI001FB19CC9|nr:putative pectinesterase/pectinesterase inhibitor 38 [Impatiens glandulifera]